MLNSSQAQSVVRAFRTAYGTGATRTIALDVAVARLRSFYPLMHRRLAERAVRRLVAAEPPRRTLKRG